MLGHYSREKSRLGEHIDTEKTHLNYNLAAHQNMNQLDFIHKRLKEVRCQKRADVKIFCDWVVTMPKDLPVEERDRFFQHTYVFLENKYGKENIVSAWVHMDETTPHMHFAFMPIVPDKRRGGYKVSAKECITKQELKTFHNKLSDYLEETLGHKVSILNGATIEGNRSIAELRRQSAAERLKEIEAKKAEAEAMEQEARDIINKLKTDLAEVKKDRTLLGRSKGTRTIEEEQYQYFERLLANDFNVRKQKEEVEKQMREANYQLQNLEIIKERYTEAEKTINDTVKKEIEPYRKYLSTIRNKDGKTALELFDRLISREKKQAKQQSQGLIR